jgi:hypothetical protein
MNGSASLRTTARPLFAGFISMGCLGVIAATALGCAEAGTPEDDVTTAAELRTGGCPSRFALTIDDFRGNTDTKIDAAASMDAVADTARGIRDRMARVAPMTFKFTTTQRGAGECWYDADWRDERTGIELKAAANLHTSRQGGIQLHVMSSIGGEKESTGQLWMFVDVSRYSPSGLTVLPRRTSMYTFHVVGDGSDLIRIGGARADAQ